MRKSGTYFEQIPLTQLKDLAGFPAESEPMQNRRPLQHALLCRICAKPVAVETAKTDGDGQAVHEDCYLVSVRRRRLSGEPSRRQWRRSRR